MSVLEGPILPLRLYPLPRPSSDIEDFWVKKMKFLGVDFLFLFLGGGDFDTQFYTKIEFQGSEKLTLCLIEELVYNFVDKNLFPYG